MCQQVLLFDLMARNTADGFMGAESNLIFKALFIALAIAAKGGTIFASPTPLTPNG
jgi:hypothetical protein